MKLFFVASMAVLYAHTMINNNDSLRTLKEVAAYCAIITHTLLEQKVIKYEKYMALRLKEDYQLTQCFINLNFDHPLNVWQSMAFKDSDGQSSSSYGLRTSDIDYNISLERLFEIYQTEIEIIQKLWNFKKIDNEHYQLHQLKIYEYLVPQQQHDLIKFRYKQEANLIFWIGKKFNINVQTPHEHDNRFIYHLDKESACKINYLFRFPIGE